MLGGVLIERGGHVRAQNPPPGAPLTTIDAAFGYQEVDRVQALEPQMNVSHQFSEDSTFLVGFAADTLTGATPPGAGALHRVANLCAS